MEVLIALMLIIGFPAGVGVIAWKINEGFNDPPNSVWSFVAGGFASWFAAFAAVSKDDPQSGGLTVFFIVSSILLISGLAYSNYNKTEHAGITIVCLPVQLFIGFVILPGIFILIKKAAETLK